MSLPSIEKLNAACKVSGCIKEKKGETNTESIIIVLYKSGLCPSPDLNMVILP